MVLLWQQKLRQYLNWSNASFLFSMTNHLLKFYIDGAWYSGDGEKSYIGDSL